MLGLLLKFVITSLSFPMTLELSRTLNGCVLLARCGENLVSWVIMHTYRSMEFCYFGRCFHCLKFFDI